MIATEKSRDSIPEANVKDLTELQQRGRELFSQRCKNCHTLAAAKATARVGPNLDELRPPKALVLDAIEKGRANGNGNMAADLVEGEDAEAVAQFVAVAVGNPRRVARRAVAGGPPAGPFIPHLPGTSWRAARPFRRSVRKDVVRVGTRVGL